MLHRQHTLGRAAIGSAVGRLVGMLKLGAVREHQRLQPVDDALLDTCLGELPCLVVHEAQPTEAVAEGAVGQLLAQADLVGVGVRGVGVRLRMGLGESGVKGKEREGVGRGSGVGVKAKVGVEARLRAEGRSACGPSDCSSIGLKEAEETELSIETEAE